MSRTLDLPEPLSEEMNAEAAREGVSPADHATLLLYIAAAQHDTGKRATPFQEAVKTFLASRSLDAERVATVLDELLLFCLGAPTGGAGSRPFPAFPYDTLSQWRHAVVHSAAEVNGSVVTSSVPPLKERNPKRERPNRSDEETTPTNRDTWPANFFEETYGSLSDEPLERLPQGDYERRESLV